MQLNLTKSPPFLSTRTYDCSSQNGPRVIVVTPTYNEINNLPALVDRVFSLGINKIHVIVVDDGSPDGTGEVARKLSERFRGSMTVIQRNRKMGLGSAYIEGFRKALGQDVDFIIQMDADLSHSPEIIPEMLNKLERADVVVGSRYVYGAESNWRWGTPRHLISLLSNLGIRILFRLAVHDVTAGFKAFRAEALGSIQLEKLKCKGFGFQAEMAVECEILSLRVLELPISFQHRTSGQSKMSIGIVIEAFWKLVPTLWRNK